ncbi:MAG TPA: 4-alpha-glucanotransferase [Hyphomicrobiales bacterium]|nr:4-alpha-glucanotransferase [Hyphomicrobiales bacterium]
MTDQPAALDLLADKYGIERSYYDSAGRHHPVPDETVCAVLAAMGVAAETPAEIAEALAAPLQAGDPDLAEDAGACFSVAEATAGGPLPWGFTAPLYGLVSDRDQAVGDFENLARMAEIAAAKGADFLGINPVHALFPARPEWVSPYSPSSRQGLNIFHIAVDKVPEFETSEPARRALEASAAAFAALRDGELIDYAAVAALKWPLYEALFEAFETGGGARRAAFEAFRQSRGEGLRRRAVFDVLSEHFTCERPDAAGWPCWPQAYRDPRSGEVARFAGEDRGRVAFHEYLQWLADEQLAAAQARARAAGMRLGLYLDIAVGVAGHGADFWAEPEMFGRGVSLGAPPDAFDSNGQNWGLAPFNPHALKRTGYAPFAAMLKSAMTRAGMIRIDHVLGFVRTFWIPEGLPGTYVRFPLDDLLAVTARESRAARSVVVGEDLGNVPEGLREAMARRNVLGYRVTWFEREWGGDFRTPEKYPRDAIATLTTHDLPTLRGFMGFRDIEWRERIGRHDPEAIAAERTERDHDLWRLTGMAGVDLAASERDDREELSLALHRRLASSPAAAVAAGIEDALGLVEQPNLPGTVDEHPNWRRRLPVSLEEIADVDRFDRLCTAMTEGRSGAGE